MKKSTVKTRRKFDNIFKREAVQNWLSSGKSAEVIADELGLSSNLLHAWKKLFAPEGAGGARRRGPSPARPPIGNPHWLPPAASWPEPIGRPAARAPA